MRAFLPLVLLLAASSTIAQDSASKTAHLWQSDSDGQRSLHLVCEISDPCTVRRNGTATVRAACRRSATCSVELTELRYSPAGSDCSLSVRKVAGVILMERSRGQFTTNRGVTGAGFDLSMTFGAEISGAELNVLVEPDPFVFAPTATTRPFDTNRCASLAVSTGQI